MPTLPEITTPASLNLISAGKAIEAPSIAVNTYHDPVDATYQVTAVSVSGVMTPVTGKHLRNAGLREILRTRLRAELLDVNPELATAHPMVKTFLKGTTGRKTSAAKLAEPDAELLTGVALVHTLARLTHDFPVVSVARALNTERFKAARLVRTARTEGYL